MESCGSYTGGRTAGSAGGGLALSLAGLAAFLSVSLFSLAITPPPAHAALAWIHKEKLGSVEEPTFTRAGKMAIDGNGDLYVIDASSTNWGLKRFHADGTPSNFAALGTNVIDGAGVVPPATCPRPSDECDGTPDGKTASSAFDTVAIDRSGGATNGNIYVSTNRAASPSGNEVDIFSSEGQYLGQLTRSSKGPFGEVYAVTVDEAGNVFVADSGLEGSSHGNWVHRYEPSGSVPTNADNVASFAEARFSVIVAGAGDSDGYFFATGIRKRDSETGTELYRFGSGNPRTVDPMTGHVFAAAGNKALEWNALETKPPAVPVAEVQDAGSTVSGLAVAEGAETLYLSGHAEEKVDVYQKTQIPEATIGPPVTVSGAKATVSGSVDPDGVEVGECFFEYGKTTSYGQKAPCVPAAAELGSGTDSVPVRGDLSGMLANGNTYHYRLVVRGALGGQHASDDEELITAETFTADPATPVTQTEATLRGTVKPEGLELTGCRFEWGETADYGQEVPCDPHFSTISNDDQDHPVSAALGGLEPSTFYHYRLVAENELGQIVSANRTLFTQGKPRIFEQTPIEVEQTTATLQARINPAGAPTSYHFEWATQAEFQQEGKYGNRVPLDAGSSAGGDSEPVRVQESLSGLRVAGRYHFRVVATNSFGTNAGPDQPFQTLGANGLPDNREYELITPADKGAAASIADSFSGQQLTQASEDGESFMYPLLNGLEDSTSGGWLRYMASRGGSGWLSAQISAPALIVPPGEMGLGIAQPSKIRFASPDNGCVLLESYNPLTADTPPESEEFGVENLYRWSVGNGQVPQRSSSGGEIQYRPAQEGEAGYTLISNRLPLNPEAPGAFNGRFYEQVEAADDCSVVYFRTGYQLIKGASGLYEWDEGTLRDAGVLPGGKVGDPVDSIGRAVPGGEVDPRGTGRANAVSPDGSRMFFTAIANQGTSAGTPAVFMREDGGARVVEVSKSKTAVPSRGARFEAASPDGTRVVFRANYGIAQPSSGGPIDQACGPRSGETIHETNAPLEQRPCDLYVYDVGSEGLTNISADVNPADAGIGAQVQGAVAIDEDGSHVYFAALGQLIAGKGRTYAQNTAGNGSANVYLRRAGEPLAYVATLSRAGDLVGMGGGLMRIPRESRAATAPDGARLLFASSRNLTNYETGGSDKLAAYLYSAADGGDLRCVSCRPDGLPLSAIPLPLGDHQSRWLLPNPQGFNLYRPRSLSVDGSRVLFTSPDALATGAVEGRRNVYQWQEGQVSFLAIAEQGGVNGLRGFQDMSADGDDVFLASAHRLAPHDKDFVSDVYDVRVDGGIPFEEEPPDCQVNEGIALEPNQIYCQGAVTPQPPGANPASAAPSAGNLPPPGPNCKRFARQAKRLSQRAKRLGRAARKANRRSHRRAAVRIKGKSRRLGKRAKRRSNAAKRCRRGARPANTNRGGSR